MPLFRGAKFPRMLGVCCIGAVLAAGAVQAKGSGRIFVANEKSDRGTEGQENAEGQPGPRTQPSKRDQQESGKGSGDSGQYQCDRGALPAQEGAYHGQHVDVTQAHAFFAAQPVPEIDDQDQCAGSEQHSYGGIGEAGSR